MRLGVGVAYAGFWRRLGAGLLDLLVLLLALSMLEIASSALGLGGGARDGAGTAGVALGAALGLLVLAVMFWFLLSATPGKLLLGCQVLDARTGRPLGLAKASLRGLGYVVSALPLGLGFLWIAWDRHKQGWHDKLAGSVVVMEDESRLSLKELEEALR